MMLNGKYMKAPKLKKTIAITISFKGFRRYDFNSTLNPPIHIRRTDAARMGYNKGRHPDK